MHCQELTCTRAYNLRTILYLLADSYALSNTFPQRSRSVLLHAFSTVQSALEYTELWIVRVHSFAYAQEALRSLVWLKQLKLYVVIQLLASSVTLLHEDKIMAARYSRFGAVARLI